MSRENYPSANKNPDANNQAVKKALATFLHTVVADNEVVRGSYKREDGVNKETVSHNLKMMEEQMSDLALEESMGGNAGGVNINGENFSCRGLNGYADKETGRILVFGNIQDISKEILKAGTSFTFREAVSLRVNSNGQEKKIVDFLGSNQFSEKGRRNIEAAIGIYNKKYWPPIG